MLFFFFSSNSANLGNYFQISSGQRCKKATLQDYVYLSVLRNLNSTFISTDMNPDGFSRTFENHVSLVFPHRDLRNKRLRGVFVYPDTLLDKITLWNRTTTTSLLFHHLSNIFHDFQFFFSYGRALSFQLQGVTPFAISHTRSSGGGGGD